MDRSPHRAVRSSPVAEGRAVGVRAALLGAYLHTQLPRGLAAHGADRPQLASLAWPGAAPFAGEGVLTLPGNDLAPPPVTLEAEDAARRRFDPSACAVMPIQGRGATRCIDHFLARYHYEGARGMNGPRFGLYWYGDGRRELVGVACFGRLAHPRWAQLAFIPRAEDLAARASGTVSPAWVAARLVAESEYLELNRLALADPADTNAPLGRHAASWFVARCLQAFGRRNRALWLAQTAREHGRALTPAAAALLRRARLDDPGKGLGFVKAVVSFADPAQRHRGVVYQATRFHYCGLTADGQAVLVDIGERTGLRLAPRTINKARRPQRGHDTAVVRLLYEGGHGGCDVWDGARLVHADTAPWARGPVPAGTPLDPALQARWRDAARVYRAQFGHHVRVTMRWDGGGTRRTRTPPKHRYLQLLGSPYWQWQVARRSVYLGSRCDAIEHAWTAAAWGPRPDPRASFYPH